MMRCRDKLLIFNRFKLVKMFKSFTICNLIIFKNRSRFVFVYFQMYCLSENLIKIDGYIIQATDVS
jgi:hypothetical protein